MTSIPFTLGIEEEYQIIDPANRELTSYVRELLGSSRVEGEAVRGEFMKSQVEAGTRICQNVKEAREQIRRMRQAVIEAADEEGLWICSAGTHPFSRWQDQVISESERYVEFAREMQQAVRSLLIFGMHVHVGFGDTPEQREMMITVMNQVRYFAPHILALSTSSPFWMGTDTGLKSYRSIVFRALPRTGLPMEFKDWSEYENYVRLLTKVGTLGGGGEDDLSDATRIWWDIRPHPQYNTLEMRICDSATTLDEAICIAAVFQALVAKLVKLRQQNMSWRVYRRDLIRENKWRAVRYGTEGKLIDFGKQQEVPFEQLVEEWIELLDDVVDDLGSRKEVAYMRQIAQHGSSADRQLRVYREAVDSGADHIEALMAVVDHLVKETRSNLS